MNIERINKWLHELRTTDKPQCRGLLHKLATDVQSEGYCCVGIACEVAIDSGLNIIKNKLINYESYDYAHVLAPESVENFYEIPPGFFGFAIGFNDSLKLSFSEIADRYEYLMNKYPDFNDIPEDQSCESINKEYLEWTRTKS